MTVKLTQVIEQMTKVNSNLEQLQENTQTVHEIANIWNTATSSAHTITADNFSSREEETQGKEMI